MLGRSVMIVGRGRLGPKIRRGIKSPSIKR